MKIKITLDKKEMAEIVKKGVSKEMLPDDHSITGIESIGYPIREWEITIEKEEESKNDE